MATATVGATSSRRAGGVVAAPRRGALVPETAVCVGRGARLPRWISRLGESDDDEAEGVSPSGSSAAATPAAWGPASDSPRANAATPARAPRLTTDIE
jgi:hypothetical protein